MDHVERAFIGMGDRRMASVRAVAFGRRRRSERITWGRVAGMVS
jgi:hypothetical protein